MPLLAHRQRSWTTASTSSASAAATPELQPLLESLLEPDPPADPGTRPTRETLETQTQRLYSIRSCLLQTAPPQRPKDAFRHLGGFQDLLGLLRSLSGYYVPGHLSPEDRTTFFQLLNAILSLLAAALQGHPGNRRFFARCVEGGGWTALEQALASTGLGAAVTTTNDLDNDGTDQLFGSLLALALADESYAAMFTNIRRNSPNIAVAQGDGALLAIRARCGDFLTGKELLYNPEIVTTIFTFWRSWYGQDTEKQGSANVTLLCLLAVLQALASSSEYNLVAIHQTGLLSAILPHVFEGNHSSLGASLLRVLAETIISLGITSLEDAKFLYRAATTAAPAADFLLAALRSSKSPSHIQFDLSLHGFASVELSTLGRPFPPMSPSLGYTLAAWVYFDTFDESTHTTIFGAFDASQTCFVLAYLEKDTRNFILQTSVTSSRPSVRFKAVAFQPGSWYHVALVHRRPRAMAASRAALFVNGHLVEHVRCQYPSSPPSAPSSSGQRQSPVQVFLGTPQDLSSRLGKDVVSSRWSLASCHLFGEALSDDLIVVYYRLGPRYQGNFQDCLGSFQTYEASALLNLRNETMHPGKEDKSDIAAAVRLKASGILSEGRIYFSITPLAVFADIPSAALEDLPVVHGLTEQAAASLHHLTRAGANAIALNIAVPAINDALMLPHGTAILTGEPVVAVRAPLDEANWRIGGSPAIGLKMVEVAHNRPDLVRAVEILLEAVRDNWRNSEAMERQNAFAILAALLRAKMGIGTTVAAGPLGDVRPIDGGIDEQQRLSRELLRIILAFIGYERDRPKASLIVNPLAYRILLVDFDTWRRTNPTTQHEYYCQFLDFATDSTYHGYNAKRLVRMRIVRRFLDALKSETFYHDTFPDFLQALKSLVRCSVSAEVLRSLALFVTYALHKSPIMRVTSVKPRLGLMTLRRRRTDSSASMSRSNTPTGPDAEGAAGGTRLLRAELGLKILEMICEILCEDSDPTIVKKFARTWLLYLLAEDEPRVVVLAAKILSRVLVVHGAAYIGKFASKSGGFVIMKQRLQRWWNIPTLWPVLFAILFDYDLAKLNFERAFDLYSLLDTFSSDGHAKVVYPEVLPVITAMLRSGLKSVSTYHEEPVPRPAGTNEDPARHEPNVSRSKHARGRSMSMNTDFALRNAEQAPAQRMEDDASVLRTVLSFLADIHARSPAFRDFAFSSDYVQELLFVLFPVIVTADPVSATTELHSRDSALTFDGADVVIRPPSRARDQTLPIVRTSSVERPPSPRNPRVPVLRRGSSFILVTSDRAPRSPSTARLNPIMSPKTSSFPVANTSHATVEALLEIVIGVFMDQVLERKDFTGFGVFFKVPPGFQEHQAYFESYILRNTLTHLGNTVQLDSRVLSKPHVLNNLSRFTSHLGEAVFEGWFLNGATPLLDFAGTLLEYLQRPDVAQSKSVRLCSQAVATIRTVFLRVVLLRLSELDEQDPEEGDPRVFLDRMAYWQTIILSPDNTEGDFLRLICYLLYTKLIDRREEVRLAAANLWRLILVQKPAETSAILNHAVTMDQKQLSSGFQKIMELDNETFLFWIDEHREDLDVFFFGSMATSWETFVSQENQRTQETAKSRVGRRRDRLKGWVAEDASQEETLRRHEVATQHWNVNIYASEHVKHQRALQDQQDTLHYIASTYATLERDLRRPCGLLADGAAQRWRLDQTEGRNRVRLRLVPDDRTAQEDEYRPKGKPIEVPANGTPKPDPSMRTGSPLPLTPRTTGGTEASGEDADNGSSDDALAPEDDFEMVEDPNEGDGFEDKNRKVMRSLQRGDQVQHVYNVSRIVGLEAVEGLLILGKDALYLLDNYFQRTDGEIVNVWQAPKEERDPYLQMIAGRQAQDKRASVGGTEHDSRSWRWGEVISISKRRFLFRDVAIEVFFTDGRSYLLTAFSPSLRDTLHQKLLGKAPHVSGHATSPYPEDAWRVEALRSHEDAPQSLGTKFANVFTSASSNPATRRWLKGELSNFHYLMLVNTMAGRTFNDLTQYPVFPWVLADYTSEELDLDSPYSFRDLSLPMGCQTHDRQAEFRDRYQSFAEMGDDSAPPFHYGTHYSSAMIVASYLIRLQPFVQSYLLLQGGSFDHADRLFFSVEKAWRSASRENMTDVRELIPEFYYLPDFLENANGYDFGVRQGTGQRIDQVVLPPWAKGDPKIFVAKHREALESPHVSKHLHQWIDLVFGFKQRGEAAIDATNVFHHLSYHGAKDLDHIEDPVERLATIGIIHNFGQTPHQVFPKAHPRREDGEPRSKRLDTAAESLTRLPFPVLEKRERVTSLQYSGKHERLLASTAFRLNMPPHYEKYLEWGYADHSVRFHVTDNHKLIGLFEHLHQGQLSCATFADSRTLITAGMDCTVSVWAVQAAGKTVELQPKTCLCGHNTPVTALAVSRSLSTFVSASTDGVVLLWDLNRLRFVRKLSSGGPVECARINDVTGNIMICRGRRVSLCSLNGQMLLEQSVCERSDDYVTCCAFYEGTGDEWLEREIIVTGHKRGVVQVWAKVIRNGAFVLELIKRLDAHNSGSDEGSATSPSITSVLPMAQAVYAGDEDGRVYQWDCARSTTA